jgi:hypothetical protein
VEGLKEMWRVRFKRHLEMSYETDKSLFKSQILRRAGEACAVVPFTGYPLDGTICGSTSESDREVGVLGRSPTTRYSILRSRVKYSDLTQSHYQVSRPFSGRAPPIFDRDLTGVVTLLLPSFAQLVVLLKLGSRNPSCEH